MAVIVLICQKISVYFLVSFISAHFAYGVLQHCVLLIKVVHSLFAFGEVVHRTLEEETEEALYAVSAGFVSTP